MKQQWKVISILVMLIIVAIFALQNTQKTVINFFFWKSISMPLVLVIFLCLLIGAIIGAGMSLFDNHGNKKRMKDLNQDLAQTKEKYQAQISEKDQTIAQLRQDKADLEERLNHTSVVTPSDQSGPTL